MLNVTLKPWDWFTTTNMYSTWILVCPSSNVIFKYQPQFTCINSKNVMQMFQKWHFFYYFNHIHFQTIQMGNTHLLSIFRCIQEAPTGSVCRRFQSRCLIQMGRQLKALDVDLRPLVDYLGTFGAQLFQQHTKEKNRFSCVCVFIFVRVPDLQMLL